jgi:type II secretory pathway pseudopilin PulG
MQSSRGTSNRHAITLIEVVVGLALLGTLLTTMMVTAGKFSGIQKSANRKSEAIKVLDELVGQLYRMGFPPEDQSEPLTEHANWQLTFRRRPWTESPERFDIVRVAIEDVSKKTAELASVELLVTKR